MENTHFSSMNEESNDTRDHKNPIPMTPTCQAVSSSCETNNSSGAGVLPACNDSGHERLRRLREEVAGLVAVPDTWGHENTLREWIDCSSFDKVLAPCGIASARESLVAEARCRASSQQLRVKRR